MFKTNLDKRSLRSALLLGAASAAVAGLSVPATAQETTETVVVTGSRIPQTGLYSSSPVTAVGQQELKFEGTQNVEQLLNNLPSVFADQETFAGNGSTGTATVNLRGLGAQRTLVLVDGKRLAPGDPSVPVPDINQIPAALIDHVEVLTGGASAVYGSDAVAGVVNFIMRKDFEGVEFDAQYGGYQHDNNNNYERSLVAQAGFKEAPGSVWDGETAEGTMIVGASSPNGKGNVTGYLSYQHQDQVLQSDRDYSACSISSYRTGAHASGAYNPYDGFTCAGSANYDLFYSLTGPLAGQNYYFMQPGGHLVPYVGDSSQTFNYGAFNSQLRPDERYNGGFFAHYQVDPALDFYSSFMFNDDHTTWQAAPSGIFFGSGPVSGAVQVNCDNPLLKGTDFLAGFCPGGVASPDLATVYVGRRNVEGGPRITDYRHTTYRMVIGARGDLGSGWSYDLSAQYGTTLFQQQYLHDLSISRVENALNSDVCDTIAGCVPLDIFHGIGGITPDMLNYIYIHGQQTGYTQEQVVTGSITGDLGQYGLRSPWAKDAVGISLGSEYRAEYLAFQSSDADQHGDLYGAGGAALPQPKAGFNVSEGFGEIRVPVIQGMPFFEDLSVNGGYRYSSYSSAGAVHSYKVGAEWQPIEDFRLRGSYNRAVRAPNVLELFSAQNQVLGDTTWNDPCAGSDPAASLAACQLTGVTAAQYGHIIQCPADQCGVLAGGNPNLAPEKSDTKTFGIVLTPTFIDGFTATVDYFDIKVNNAIGVIPQANIVSGCISGSAPELCALIHRQGNGFLFGTGGYVIDTNLNTGYFSTKGIDFEANYTMDLNNFSLNGAGSLTLNFIGTWLDELITNPYTGAQLTDASGKTYTSFDCTGLFGTGCGTPNPEWRHKLRATWTAPWDIDFSVAWRHMSSVDFAGNTINPFIIEGSQCGNSSCTPLLAGGHIPAYDYFDLAADWRVAEGVSLRAGVNNLFDKDPPLLASGGIAAGPTGPLNGNTFPGVYDPLGRYVYVGTTVKF